MNSEKFILDLKFLLNELGIKAIVFNFGDSFYITLPNDVKLTTLIIIQLANLAKKYKCTSSFSNYDDKLTFNFKFWYERFCF